MIQFNLLPDVKLEYIKAQRIKRTVVSLSVLLSVISIAIFALLIISVDVVQKKNINDLSGDIANFSKQLKGQEDLDKILTVQNQLNALTPLHDAKPVTTRIPAFISQVTPTNVTISELQVDFDQHTMTITGKAPSLDAVNVFVDSLKFTKYYTDQDSDNKDAFSNVVLSSFGRTSTGATYSISLNFDQTITSSASEVTLVVPNIVTTRSVIEHPSALFEGSGQ
ncbi:PilN domain-containing protein [Candidatus Saccharibacteria bacterium]|nr:PilN domain-containing protein [Candidatus Saccharibacteria bacterium]